MMKSGLWSSKTSPDRGAFTPVPFLLMGLLVLVAGGIGILIPTVVGKVSPGLSKFEGIGLFGITFWALIIGAILSVLIILLNQRELAAAVVIAVSLLLDWYLGTYVLAPTFALVLLLVYYVQRSAERPWIAPRALWLWAVFLVLTLIPSIRGAITVYDTLTYYPNVILGALVVFWLGTVIARNMGSVRLFFNLLAGFGTLIAIHVIIEAVTGNLLFVTANAESFLSSLSFYQLGNTGVSRPGSFFLQPDAGGAFLAVLLFIPLG